MSSSASSMYPYRVQIREVFHMLQQSATNIHRTSVISVVMILLAACSSQAPDIRHNPDAGATIRATAAESAGIRAAAIATAQIGVPYRFGGSSPGGFDCSGLIYFSYGQTGKHVPRTTTGLWQGTAPVDRTQLRTGDILFFRIEGKLAHVGMYLDGGRFVHAPASGRYVSVESLSSDFYQQAFIRGGRL